MVAMSDELSELREIQEQVLARVRIEKEGLDGLEPSIEPELKEPFILSCMHAGELGDGLLYATLNVGEVRFCADLDTWYVWNAHYWDIDQTRCTESRVERVVAAYSSVMPSDEDNLPLRKKIRRKIERLWSVAGIRNTLEMAKAARYSNDVPILTVQSDLFDQKPWLLACPNGVLDLRSGMLRDGRTGDYITVSTPTTYQGCEEPSPTWDKFISQILPEPEVALYVQKVLGYALLGECSHHFAYPQLGTGRNGKSAMNEEIQRVLGPMVCTTVNPGIFMEQRFQSSSGPTPEIMALRGAKIVFVPELPAKGLLDTPKLKRLTGKDTITGRFAYSKKESTFVPQCTFFLACNSIPHCTGDDPAGMNRLRIIHYPSTVVMDRDPRPDTNEIPFDPDLEKKFAAERSGILAWLVRGCLIYQQEGLTPPASVLKHTADYQENEDVLGMWLNDREDTDANGWTPAASLFEDFLSWCESTKICKPWGGKTFYSALANKAQKKNDSRCKMYNIILRPLMPD